VAVRLYPTHGSQRDNSPTHEEKAAGPDVSRPRPWSRRLPCDSIKRFPIYSCPAAAFAHSRLPPLLDSCHKTPTSLLQAYSSAFIPLLPSFVPLLPLLPLLLPFSLNPAANIDSHAMSDNTDLLAKLLAAVTTIQHDQKALAAAVDAINGRVNALADVKELKDAARPKTPVGEKKVVVPLSPSSDERAPPSEVSQTGSTVQKKPSTSRVILTTYPGQGGIDPVIMNWGERDPAKRGPVVVARGSQTVRRRNGSFQFISQFILFRFVN
jgi:hypothetical protein